ncbi:MAG: hypothetical protein O2913_11000 [Chloroflexi bacterium]|nr:hypothetical protein [Chloroflexota bacterium]
MSLRIAAIARSGTVVVVAADVVAGAIGVGEGDGGGMVGEVDAAVAVSV